MNNQALSVRDIEFITDVGSAATQPSIDPKDKRENPAAVFYVPRNWIPEPATWNITISALAASGLAWLTAEAVESMPLTKLLAVKIGHELSPPNVLPLIWGATPSEYDVVVSLPAGYSSGAAAFTVCSAPASAGALEASNASVFDQLQPVEQFDEKFRALLNKLEATVVPAGAAIASRVKALVEAAQDEEEPFSMDALYAFAVVAKSHPRMPYPHLTLGPKGLLAEWRESKSRAVGIYFSDITTVQFTVARDNPRHTGQVERISGSTTVDRIGALVSQVVPFPMMWLSS